MFIPYSESFKHALHAVLILYKVRYVHVLYALSIFYRQRLCMHYMKC